MCAPIMIRRAVEGLQASWTHPQVGATLQVRENLLASIGTMINVVSSGPYSWATSLRDLRLVCFGQWKERVERIGTRDEAGGK